MQTPPPIETNGSGVEHVPDAAGGRAAGGGTGGCGAGTGVPAASGDPGGTHPPFTQIQSEAGWMLVHVLGLGLGLGAAGTLGTLGAGLGGGAAPAARGWVGGTQPPFTHTHPDAGEAVRHDDVGAGVGAGAGAGAGVGVGVGAGGGGGGGVTPPAGGSHAPFTHVHPAPGDGPTHVAGPVPGRDTVAAVTKVNSSDVVVIPGWTSVACVRGTIRQ